MAPKDSLKNGRCEAPTFLIRPEDDQHQPFLTGITRFTGGRWGHGGCSGAAHRGAALPLLSWR